MPLLPSPKNQTLLFWILLSICAFLMPSIGYGQAIVPPAGESGISQKSLRQSQTRPLPQKGQIPSITVQDSRTIVDPGSGPSFIIREILIIGNTLISSAELAPIFEPGIGNKVTLGVLDLIVQEITAEYVKRGYFLSRAYLPQQEIVDGVVTVQVMEGRIGSIEIQGNKRIKSEDISQRLNNVRQEKIIREKTLERTLLDFNDIQGFHVESILKQGKDPGTSDLVFNVKESRPYTFSFDGDNYGSAFTGANRFGIATTYSSALKLGDLISFRAVRSEDGQTFLNPAYSLPVSDDGRTTLQMSYIFSEHQLGGSLALLNAGGSSHIFTMDLVRNFLRSRKGRLYAGGGMDFRYFKNYTLGAPSSDDVLFNYHFIAGGDWIDSLRGQTIVDGRLQFGYTEENTADPLNSRLMGRGDSLVATINVVRYQSAFFLDSMFMIRFNGQIADRRLLSPDQIAAGGIGTVRGFPLAEVAGDSGYTTTLEYILPLPINLPITKSPKPTIKEVFSLFAFLDHGRTSISDRQPSDGPGESEVSGAGGGLRINVPRRDQNHPAYSFSVAYGVPVFSTQRPSDGSAGTVYLGGLITY